MATAIQRPALPTQLSSHVSAGDPLIGNLNSQALPDGISPVYLQGKLYRITDKRGSEPCIACAISLLSNLQYDTQTNLQTLKQENRIGALHVQDGEIKSLTLTKDQIEMMQVNGVNEIAFQVNQRVLRIKEGMILREYTSDEEYQVFTSLF